MIAYEFKGGTGTSTRKVYVDGEEYYIDVLVQANHGLRDWLTISGVPIRKYLTENKLFDREMGSIIVIIGTNLPLLPHQLEKVARRVAIGIAEMVHRTVMILGIFF